MFDLNAPALHWGLLGFSGHDAWWHAAFGEMPRGYGIRGLFPFIDGPSYLTLILKAT